MITLSDIQTAIAAKLTKYGHTVVANEVSQGYTKPAFFIDVLPVSVSKQNKNYETVTVGIELTYHSEIETREEMLAMSERLKDIFFYDSIPVKDRFLSADEITFDTDKITLTAYFEISFMQETGTKETEYPKMKQLNVEVKSSYGTS
ncbi:MAG: hypothetical protein M0R40_09455 [Firmicutes bacterium]|nr:hypothetical protein [Bacillota bacterium]